MIYNSRVLASKPTSKKWSWKKRILAGTAFSLGVAGYTVARVVLPSIAAESGSRTSDQRIIDDTQKNYGLKAHISYRDYFSQKGRRDLANRAYEAMEIKGADHNVYFGYAKHSTSQVITILSDGIHGVARPNAFIDVIENPVIQRSNIIFLDLYGHSFYDDKTESIVTWGYKEKHDFIEIVKFAINKKDVTEIRILAKSMGAASAYMALPEILKMAKENSKIQFKIILDSPYSSLRDSAMTVTKGNKLGWRAELEAHVSGVAMAVASSWLIEDSYSDVSYISLLFSQSPIGQTDQSLVQEINSTKNVSILLLQGTQDRITGSGAEHLYQYLLELNQGQSFENVSHASYPTLGDKGDGHTTRYFPASRIIFKKIVDDFFSN